MKPIEKNEIQLFGKDCRREVINKIHKEEMKIVSEMLKSPLKKINDIILDKPESKSNNDSILKNPILLKKKQYLKKRIKKSKTTKYKSNPSISSLADDTKQLELGKRISVTLSQKSIISQSDDLKKTRNVSVEDFNDKKLRYSKKILDKEIDKVRGKFLFESVGKTDKFFENQKYLKEKPLRYSKSELLTTEKEKPLHLRYQVEMEKKQVNLQIIKMKVKVEDDLKNNIKNLKRVNNHMNNSKNLNKTQRFEQWQNLNQMWNKKKQYNLQIMYEIKQNDSYVNNQYSFKPKLNPKYTSNKLNEDQLINKMIRTKSEKMLHKMQIIKEMTPSFQPKLNKSYISLNKPSNLQFKPNKSYLSQNKSASLLETRKQNLLVQSRSKIKNSNDTITKSPFCSYEQNKSKVIVNKSRCNPNKSFNASFDTPIKKPIRRPTLEAQLQNSIYRKEDNNNSNLYMINVRDHSSCNFAKENNIVLNNKRDKKLLNSVTGKNFVNFNKTLPEKLLSKNKSVGRINK